MRTLEWVTLSVWGLNRKSSMQRGKREHITLSRNSISIIKPSCSRKGWFVGRHATEWSAVRRLVFFGSGINRTAEKSPSLDRTNIAFRYHNVVKPDGCSLSIDFEVWMFGGVLFALAKGSLGDVVQQPEEIDL